MIFTFKKVGWILKRKLLMTSSCARKAVGTRCHGATSKVTVANRWRENRWDCISREQITFAAHRTESSASLCPFLCSQRAFTPFDLCFSFTHSLFFSFSFSSSLCSTLLALLSSRRFSPDQLFLLLRFSSLSPLFLPACLVLVNHPSLSEQIPPASPLAAPPWYSSLINCVYTAVNSYRCLAPANWSLGPESSRASTRPQRRHTPGVSSV